MGPLGCAAEYAADSTFSSEIISTLGVTDAPPAVFRSVTDAPSLTICTWSKRLPLTVKALAFWVNPAWFPL